MKKLIVIVLVLLVSGGVCFSKVLERDQYGNPTKYEMTDRNGLTRNYTVGPDAHVVETPPPSSGDGKPVHMTMRNGKFVESSCFINTVSE